MQEEQDQKKYSFEEFKLYYESTEKVTDRRLDNNKWNYSICSAILLATVYIWSWSIKNPGYKFIAFFTASLLSLMATFFVSLWISQIRDFKALNSAKFYVLNDIIAPNLYFDTQKHDLTLCSSNPFQKEWEKLSAAQALQKKSKFYGIKGLKSTDIEFFIPRAFRVVFVLLFLVSFMPILLNFGAFIQGLVKLVKP